MPPPDASPPPTGIHILVVDDEKPVRLVAQRMLERLGHHATAVATSAEALAAVTQPETPIQLVLVDMHLREEDGLLLAGSLRALLPAAPIVIMGGDIDEPARRFQRRDARMHLLAKPFAFADLQRVLGAALAKISVDQPRAGDPCL